MTTGSRIHYNRTYRPKLRNEEIQERVKIPVDEGLGGCRGFESHRPHHRNCVRTMEAYIGRETARVGRLEFCVMNVYPSYLFYLLLICSYFTYMTVCCK